MKMLLTIVTHVRALFTRGGLDAEMDEEMQVHIDLQTQANLEAGMPEEEARRAAFREFGHLEAIKESCRDQRAGWFGRQLSMTVRDVRFALRQLRRNPGFTAVAVITLSLGIGSTAAIYSVLNHLILEPVPGPEPERLLQIAERYYSESDKTFHFFGVSPPVLEGLRANEDFFAEFAMCESQGLEMPSDDFARRVGGAFVSPNFFDLWGVPPVFGRTFAEDEAVILDDRGEPAEDGVIVLSHSWWDSTFQADPDVLGTTMELGGRNFAIIGVMPEHFTFPWGSGKFWIPTEDRPFRPERFVGANTKVLARLKPGTSLREVQNMLDAVAQRIGKELEGSWGYAEFWSRRPGGLQLETRPVRYAFQAEKMAENLRQTLFGLLAAMGFVLLIVCANIATLTLARGERRQQEFAVRTALGAGRVRLMRQLLTESLLLGCIGGLGGLVVTFWGIDLLMTLVPEYLPRVRAVEIDGFVLGTAFLLSLATGASFGLIPAWRASRNSLGDAVKQAGLTTTAGIWRSRYRDGLVVVQVALAVVLLAGAGLMVQSVIRLLHVDPGYDPENLLRVGVRLEGEYFSSGSPDPAERILNELHQRIISLPGVLAVGLYKNSGDRLDIEGPRGLVRIGVRGCGVEESDFFGAMGVPLLAGRLLNRSDIESGFFFDAMRVDGVSAVVINRTLADLFWPGEDPLGKTFAASPDFPRTYEVVGVVGDVNHYSYSERREPLFYRPYPEFHLTGQPPMFLIRIATDPDTLTAAIRRELLAADPAMRMPGIDVVSKTLYDSTEGQRTFMTYLTAFAGLGLLLAAIGIYGVLAYSVVRRTREIGIRMAIGSRRWLVVKLVMMEGMRLILIGLALGLVAAFLLTRFLENQLFDVNPADPVIFAGVALLLFVVASLACLLPAIRATRIQPLTALRYE